MLNFQMSLEKREMFVWKEVHEKALITEVLTVEPHQFKHGTKERSAAWTAIAELLNEMNIGFKVIQRLVREKFEKMMKDYEKKQREEKGASGVSVQYSGIYRSLEDIKGRIAEINEVQQVESLRKKKKRHRLKKYERKQWRNTLPQKSGMLKQLTTMRRSLSRP